MISLDTETTGVDLRYGARPFLVTVANDEAPDEPYFWEWDVDPLSRMPLPPKEELAEIQALIDTEDVLILQNPKFDATALNTLGIVWPWEKVFCTLIAGHLLNSAQPHDLTTMALIYLGWNIQPYEDDAEELVNDARKLARKQFPTWRLAKEGLREMPSAKSGSKKGAKGVESEKPWKFDMWLPRALAKKLEYDSDHPWWTVTSLYANCDSTTTMMLFRAMKEELIRKDLWEIYVERMRVLPVIHKMEDRGVTYNQHRLDSLKEEYTVGSDEAGTICKSIAAKYDFELTLPKSGRNDSLNEFCFSPKGLNLPVLKYTDTGNPSFDKDVKEAYLLTLDPGSDEHEFIKTLSGKSLRDTRISYMEGYVKYGLAVPLPKSKPLDRLISEWYCLHPSLNPTGTNTLRFSSSNPNEQNISNHGLFEGDIKTLRYCFGPLPGREWWSLDAQNIELRLPAFESGEQAFIDLFERPNDPPYFGSNHLLIAHVLHPKLFEACRDAKGNLDGRIFKKRHPDLYGRVKNGNFAVQYGAIEASGTADRAYGVRGAQAIVQKRFTRQAALNQYWIDFANKTGYVETIPDRSVCPQRGYPIYCSRTSYGKISPTVPFNYHVQSSAMWWMMKAMIRVQEQLDIWNDDWVMSSGGAFRLRKKEPQYFMAMQVHDELVFDFPKGYGAKPWLTNLPKIKKIQQLMEQGGIDYNIPTPTSREYHPDNWSVGVTV